MKHGLSTLEQLFVITAEEAGEVVQASSKILRKGADKWYLHEDALKDFQNEIGDLLCMVNLLHEYDIVSWNDIDDRAEVKREKLKKWSDLIDGGQSRAEYEKVRGEAIAKNVPPDFT